MLTLVTTEHSALRFKGGNDLVADGIMNKFSQRMEPEFQHDFGPMAFDRPGCDT
jgi:hypothetical protein